jgi:hypothetical protein
MAVTPDSSAFRQALSAISTRMAVAAVVAFVGAAIWSQLADASFVERFGWLLAIGGAVMTMPRGGVMFGRQDTQFERKFLGWGPQVPEPDLDVGGVGLTRIGVLLFVSIPLFVLGALISNLA